MFLLFILLFLYSVTNCRNEYYEKNWQVYEKKNNTESEGSQNNKNDSNFQLLDDSSLVKKICTKNPDNYHCKKLNTFIFCANNHASKEHIKKTQNRISLGKANDTDYQTIATNSLCSYNENQWDDSIGDKTYWSLFYHVNKLCEENNISSQETLKEITSMIKTLLKLQANCRKK